MTAWASERRGWINTPPDLTRTALCERLAVRGVASTGPAWWHPLHRGNLRCKQTRHASAPARTDGPSARAEWQEPQPSLDMTQLVCVEEMGASSTLTRLRGRAPSGARGIAAVSHGPGKTTTCITGLRVRAVTASLGRDDSMDGETLLVYGRAF